jgi:hypothetical protein
MRYTLYFAIDTGSVYNEEGQKPCQQNNPKLELECC